MKYFWALIAIIQLVLYLISDDKDHFILAVGFLIMAQLHHVEGVINEQLRKK